MVIIIDKDKKMMINTEPTDRSALGERLMDVFKTRAEKVVFVKGDPVARFQGRRPGYRYRARAPASTRSV